jgi:glucan phosphoethanolaminetransferase (alkaline phosphatase superfamily)
MLDLNFDLINGLPIHALVVHAVVVLLPLLAVVTVIFVVRPKWRPELPWAILGNAALFLITFVAKASGEKLQARLSTVTGSEVAAHHAALGKDLQYFAFAQLIASLLAWVLLGTRSQERPAARPALALALLVTLIAGGAATYWTYRVGDSGATAVWKDTIANTKAP